MPQVLTTNAIIVCPHGGVGTSTPIAPPKWSVNGGSVLLENDTGTLDCKFPQSPCTSYILKSMGLNATKVDERKVILVSDFNQSLTGLPLTMTEFHQTIDNSTPASIPPGEDAPPLSPELADTMKPVVTGIPPILAFNSTTSLPPAATVTFNLFSNFPLRWILTLINGGLTPGSSEITNGDPSFGLTVLPAGGEWNTTNFTVTMTMTATYMASLGIGTHDFFMTGINQRGLSGFNDPPVKLTVS
jgi:hypothetical protein